MTEQEKQPRLAVTAPAGSRLEELLATYESVKANAEEAAARFKSLTDAVKAELSAEHPGITDMVLTGAPGLPALRLAWVESWRLASKRLKEEDPLTYVKYAEKSGHWELRAL